MTPPRGRLPGMADQIHADAELAVGTVRVAGREPMPRIELALTILDEQLGNDEHDGIRSPNLDPSQGPSGGHEIEDPEHPGETVKVELTSVEASAIARIGRAGSRRTARMQLVELADAIEEAEAATRRLRYAMVAVTGMPEAETSGKAGTEVTFDGTKWRPVCRWHHQVARTPEEERIGDRDAGPLLAAEGEEPARIPVCKGCYRFAAMVLRAPTIAELEHSRDRGKFPKVHRREEAS
ncbi:MAG: hypothetical protein AAGA99_26570 [Actinomycetota bacterium]